MDLKDLNKSSSQILETISDNVTKAPNLGALQDDLVGNFVTPLQGIGNNTQKFVNKLDVPLPKKKNVTFSLSNENGELVNHGNPKYALGYMFTMSVNPSSFKISYPAKTVNQIRTMGGWVLQHWYPEIGTISCDGIIGNLLQRYNRDTKDTDRWQYFDKLRAVFLNNGVPYQSTPFNRQTKQFNPVAKCLYDEVEYIGYFESFNMSESQENPWTRDYDFTFRFVSMNDTSDMVARTIVGGVISSFTHNLTKGVLGQTGQAVDSIISPLTQR